MACRLDGAKPLFEPMLEYYDWTLRNKLKWNFTWNSNIFVQESALESVVCEMASIFSRPQCAKLPDIINIVVILIFNDVMPILYEIFI